MLSRIHSKYSEDLLNNNYTCESLYCNQGFGELQTLHHCTPHNKKGG